MCHEHGFKWLSLSICLYHPSHSAGPPESILCLYRTVIGRFEPYVKHLLVRVKEFTEPRLWAHSYFSISDLACLVRLIWLVLEIGGRWPYSCCFVGCLFQDFFNTARRILVQLPSSFFSGRLASVYVVPPYSSMDTIGFILSDRSDFYMTDSL